MSSPNDLRKGTVINLNNELWVVVEFQRVSPGKGSSFVRTRLKNLKSGKVVEQAFKSAETLTFEDVSYKKMQYLFNDGQMYSFMDNITFEQIQLSKAEIGDDAKFLKDGLEVTIIMHQETPIAIQLPQKIKYTVASAPPVVKGDTAAGNVTKEIILDNGLAIRSPIFIEAGNTIIVNTESGEYSERV